MDAGGVTRDLYSGFWEVAYLETFDDGCLLIPAVHPQVDMTKFSTLGQILSHGYLVCGFLPLRIAFPIVALTVLGPKTKISEQILIESFLDYLVQHEMKTIQNALSAAHNGYFSTKLSSDLTNLLSRHGCRTLPKLTNVRQLIIEVARYEFTIKAAGATCAMHVGIPEKHKEFWSGHSIEELYEIYRSLNGRPDKLIKRLIEPEEMSSNEERVYEYFVQFIGSLDVDDLRLLMRSITGSSAIGHKSSLQWMHRG